MIFDLFGGVPFIFPESYSNSFENLLIARKLFQDTGQTYSVLTITPIH